MKFPLNPLDKQKKPEENCKDVDDFIWVSGSHRLARG